MYGAEPLHRLPDPIKYIDKKAGKYLTIAYMAFIMCTIAKHDIGMTRLSRTICLMLLLSSPLLSAENTADQINNKTMPSKEADAGPVKKEEQPKRVFRHVVRKDISVGEKLLTLGIVYTVQWGYYLIFQWDTIKKYGSFSNWYTNIYQPHFDRDSYDYNLIWHTLTGTCYYLFFRSRGHTKSEALLWGFLSQLLFEFTIETMTEKPSFQDMFQTPVLGAVVGIALEWLSNKLLSTNCAMAHLLGVILNPFALMPWSSYRIVSSSQITSSRTSYAVTIRF